MNTYLVTIAINTDTKPDRLLTTCERMTRDWFGSSASIDSIVTEDPDQDPTDWDTRTCAEQATDDHNEGVTYSLGWHKYQRTDGLIVTFVTDREED
jgi:hypothetical protein